MIITHLLLTSQHCILEFVGLFADLESERVFKKKLAPWSSW